jgi:hypothetical protein
MAIPKDASTIPHLLLNCSVCDISSKLSTAIIGIFPGVSKWETVQNKNYVVNEKIIVLHQIFFI